MSAPPAQGKGSLRDDGSLLDDDDGGSLRDDNGSLRDDNGSLRDDGARRGAGVRRDDGMVTAETAAVLPVLVLVAVFAVAVVLAAGQRNRLVDAAHVTALAAARGDPAAAALGERIAPGAAVAVAASDDTVTVTVSDTLDVGPVHGPHVSVTAIAPLEPDPAASVGTGAAP